MAKINGSSSTDTGTSFVAGLAGLGGAGGTGPFGNAANGTNGQSLSVHNAAPGSIVTQAIGKLPTKR
jgi:hypothetical protein